jgi:hypothetical protein
MAKSSRPTSNHSSTARFVAPHFATDVATPETAHEGGWTIASLS